MIEKPSRCRNCNNLTVLADAGLIRSIPYFYCRKCKIEVDAWGWEIKPSRNTEELDEYLKDITEKIPLTNLDLEEEDFQELSPTYWTF